MVGTSLANKEITEIEIMTSENGQEAKGITFLGPNKEKIAKLAFSKTGKNSLKTESKKFPEGHIAIGIYGSFGRDGGKTPCL